MSETSSPCGGHIWKEDYYGWKCKLCGLFYPFGCAPWDEAEDDSEDE